MYPIVLAEERLRVIPPAPHGHAVLLLGFLVSFLRPQYPRIFLFCLFVSGVCLQILPNRPTPFYAFYRFCLLTTRCVDVAQVSNGAAGWGYIAETSALRLRPHTAGFGAAVTCVAGVVMNVVTPYMVNANKWNWGFKTGWFYAGVGLPFLIGTWLLLPETKGYVSAISQWRHRKGNINC